MSLRMLTLLPLIAIMALATTALACGDDDDGGAATEIRADLSEWKIALNQTSVPGGNVKFTARNMGTQNHELVVIKTDTDPAKLPITGTKVDESKAGTTIGEIEEFEPGKTESQTFDLASGKYALICNIPGHYESGMHAGLTVQ